MLEEASGGAGTVGLGDERARLETVGAAIVNEAIAIHRELGAALMKQGIVRTVNALPE